jgi:voltage-dependent potassium channel beta subunit
MHYRKLGRWGMAVSAIGLGSWLTYGGSVEEETARRCVRRAYDRGVTFFDTANVYAMGRAEEILGRALADLPRSDVVLATKVFFPMGNGPNDRGLSRKHIRGQIDASLRRLGVEYVDLYQCHRYDVRTPLEETCGAMNDLVRTGKILYWGTSEWTADQIVAGCTLARARGWAEPVSNQPQYSALWRGAEERVFPTCREFGLGNVAWSPLAMGVLTGKYARADRVPPGSRAAGPGGRMMGEYTSQRILDAVQQLRPLAERAGCTPAQLALAWCLRDEIVAAAIVGATRPEQLDETLAAADLEIDWAVFSELERILAPVAPYDPDLA